jgi:hypothetical protein
MRVNSFFLLVGEGEARVKGRLMNTV